MINKPIYLIIFDDIKEKIHKNELKAGDILPSESMLCKEYGTSRMTVRKAITQLINFGYVYSVPGVGSFVNNTNPDVYKLYFHEINSIIPDVNETEVLDIDVILPDEDIIYNLQVPKDTRVIFIKLLYRCSGTPVAYNEKYIPYVNGLPLIEKEIKYATFPEIVASKVSQFVIKKDIMISTDKADETISRYLMINEGDPIMKLEQKILDDRHHIIGYGRIFYRYDSFNLKATSGY